MNWIAFCTHSKEKKNNFGRTNIKCQWKNMLQISPLNTHMHAGNQTHTSVCATRKESRCILHLRCPALTVREPVWDTTVHCHPPKWPSIPAEWPQKWLLIILASTLALLWSVYHVRVGCSIDADSPVWDPGLVNTSFHPLHDKIQ